MTKGLGWFVDEYNMSQISLNLNDYEVTPIHTAFEEVKMRSGTQTPQIG